MLQVIAARAFTHVFVFAAHTVLLENLLVVQSFPAPLKFILHALTLHIQETQLFMVQPLLQH